MDIKTNRRVNLFIALGTSIGLIMAGISISFYFSVQKPSTSYGIDNSEFIKKMYDMKIKEKEFQESKEFINQAINISNEIKNQAKNYNFANAIQINQLDLKIEKLDEKIENLYHAVNSNPEKSLSIPMINKDIDNLEDKVKILSDNFDHQIDRTYQMFMWVCGTLALGVLGLIITVVIAFKQK